MYNRVVIRVDADALIGLGHLIRCISLAHMIRNGFDIRFFVLNPGKAVLDVLRQNKYDVFPISSEDDFFEKLRGDEIVILDGYKFDTLYQARVKRESSFLVCIDDLHDKHFFADVVINHAPGIQARSYSAENYTQFLLGPDYALLRPGFVSHAKSKSLFRIGSDVFINFGGADFKNLTIRAIEAVLEVCSDRNLTVVTGSAYPHHSELGECIDLNPDRIRHFHSLTEEAMVDTITHSGLAIVPASGVLFEVVACRVACVSGYYTQNQYDIYSGFKKKGVFHDARQFEMPQLKEAIVTALSLENNDQLRRQCEILDGLSPLRYENFFKSIRSPLLR